MPCRSACHLHAAHGGSHEQHCVKVDPCLRQGTQCGIVCGYRVPWVLRQIGVLIHVAKISIDQPHPRTLIASCQYGHVGGNTGERDRSRRAREHSGSADAEMISQIHRCNRDDAVRNGNIALLQQPAGEQCLAERDANGKFAGDPQDIKTIADRSAGSVERLGYPSSREPGCFERAPQPIAVFARPLRLVDHPAREIFAACFPQSSRRSRSFRRLDLMSWHDGGEICARYPAGAPCPGLDEYKSLVFSLDRDSLSLGQYKQRIAHGNG